MAMDGDVLGTEMKNAIDGLSFTDASDREKVMQALGNAIVPHIEVNGDGTKYVPIARYQFFNTTAPVIGAWTLVDISGAIPVDAFAVQMMTKLYNPDTDSLMYWGPIAASSELELFVGSASNYWGSAAGIVNVGPSRTLQYLAQGDASWNFNRAFIFGYYINVSDT
jgi:hypothetical protein